MALVASGFCIVMTMHFSLSRQVGGGTPIRPVLRAVGIAIMLWILVFCLRHCLPEGAAIGVIVPTGIVYLIMQYLILRRNMEACN
jgi:hypothetical protein